MRRSWLRLCAGSSTPPFVNPPDPAAGGRGRGSPTNTSSTTSGFGYSTYRGGGRGPPKSRPSSGDPASLLGGKSATAYSPPDPLDDDDEGGAPHLTSSKDEREAAISTRLIDKLKDYSLQGQWAKAMRVFDQFDEPQRKLKWQSYHYELLLSILEAAHRSNVFPRVWQAMKDAGGDSVFNKRTLNSAMMLSLLEKDQFLIDNVMSFIEAHGVEMRPSVRIALQQRELSDWETALSKVLAGRRASASSSSSRNASITIDFKDEAKLDEQLQLNSNSATSKASKSTLAADAVASSSCLSEQEIVRQGNAIVRNCPSAEAAAVICHRIQSAGVQPNGQFYASWIRKFERGQWADAMAVFAQSELNAQTSAATFDALLGQCTKSNHLDAALAVLQEMHARRIPHSEFTVLSTLRVYELKAKIRGTTKQEHDEMWSEACHYLAEAQMQGLGKTDSVYSSTMRFLTAVGRGNEAMRLHDQMRDRGMPVSNRTTLSLIQAWSDVKAYQKRKWLD